jgi:hypothetical protein
MWSKHKGDSNMKKFILFVIFCLVPAFCYAEDIKMYDKNYRYVGKVDTTTGRIYDRNYKRVGRVDVKTGNVYDNNYKRVGTTRSTFGSSRR